MQGANPCPNHLKLLKENLMRTKAQEWAQQRNWHKARLIGARNLCYNKTLTKDEVIHLNKIKVLLEAILNQWDSNNTKSKKQFLS